MPVRAHAVLPEDLIERVDHVAGKRRRSRFVEEAVREKLAREALAVTLDRGSGILDPADYPEWSTPERTSRWVATLRELDQDWLPGSRSENTRDEGSSSEADSSGEG